MYQRNAFEEACPSHGSRRHPRYEVQCRARILIGARHYAGYIHNISEGGAKLRTVSSIRKIGEVVLRLPDLRLLKGRLTWSDAYHAGVAFELPLAEDELYRWVQKRMNFRQLNGGHELDCELFDALHPAAATLGSGSVE